MENDVTPEYGLCIWIINEANHVNARCQVRDVITGRALMHISNRRLNCNFYSSRMFFPGLAVECPTNTNEYLVR